MKEREIKGGIYKAVKRFKGMELSREQMMEQVEEIYSIVKEQEEY